MPDQFDEKCDIRVQTFNAVQFHEFQTSRRKYINIHLALSLIDTQGVLPKAAARISPALLDQLVQLSGNSSDRGERQSQIKHSSKVESHVIS